MFKALTASSANFRVQGSQAARVAVVGAGAFGGWTALYLLRHGARVTLLDAWGPGNARASSGGESRIIRGTYEDQVYAQMAARALELWREHEKRWGRKVLHPIGVLWMAGADDHLEKKAVHFLREAGFRFEELSVHEAARRFPQINFDGVHWAIWEKDSGYLTARRACRIVLESFLDEGGNYRELSVKPGKIEGGKLQALTLSDGSALTADWYVFACGPWLGKIFPEVLGSLIKPTRQEVFFFGTPAGDPRFVEGSLPATAGLPVWIDNGETVFYGIPGNQWRGFKAACDSRGPEFDPTSGERIPTAEGIEAARKYVGFRFPGMRDAPLLGALVCQYENSSDHHFIIDRHPEAENVWLLGGGSGHGFKHGPALGEMVSDLVLNEKMPNPLFRLSRFSEKSPQSL